MVATERWLALLPAGSHQCHVAGVGTRRPWAEDFATVVDRAASTRTRAYAELNHIWQLARFTKCKTRAMPANRRQAVGTVPIVRA